MTEFPSPSVSKAPRRVCLDAERAGLMVIDVQNGFVNSSSALVVPPIVDLVERWTTNNRPVLMSRYRNYSGSPYERLLGWRELHRAPDIDIIDALVGFLDHPMTTVIDKTGYTALTVEAVEHWHGAGVTDLILCGIATDGCVFKTALDVFEAGFTPWVVVDAVASNTTRHRAQEIHESALLLLARLIGADQLILAADIISALIR
ncbi:MULTISPECIES: cysteine hydrolase family protein [Nocardia]|uniref:Probable isochorismatase n=1 Tax=Nocardia africana TaxID=134964 RepID=A0A378X6N6_9NOCA|nr:isochorismatase family cysteine hydrolase [Nocardia africana]MCC3317883.1 cysteine hydrolase [Nocardia africana]SUA48657.1 Probable isochorismatase [Nocardia africana]